MIKALYGRIDMEVGSKVKFFVYNEQSITMATTCVTPCNFLPVSKRQLNCVPTQASIGPKKGLRRENFSLILCKLRSVNSK